MTGKKIFVSVSIPKERNFLLPKHGQCPEHFKNFAFSPVYSNETVQENHDNIKVLEEPFMWGEQQQSIMLRQITALLHSSSNLADYGKIIRKVHAWA